MIQGLFLYEESFEVLGSCRVSKVPLGRRAYLWLEGELAMKA